MFCFYLIHSGAPNDVNFLINIENLQKRRIIQKGEIIIFDKWYCSYDNYLYELTNIRHFLLFSKKRFQQNKA